MQVKLLVPVSIAALAVLGAAVVLVRQGASHGPAAPGERKVISYQDSMHPWVKSDRPGKCTICDMDLTPIYEGQTGFSSASNLVAINSNQVTVLNVQTEEVKRRPLRRSVRVAGTLEANETSKTVVSAPARGRIDALAVDYAGIEVEQGQKLITMFSPELVQLRKTLLAVRQNNPQGATNPVSQANINAGLYTGDILAPQSGVVLERNVYNGQYVSEGDRLLVIVDASVLWFRFDVYQPQLPWFELGETIEVEVPGISGKVFPAVISFVEPTFNEATRTVKVRADIRNPVMEVDGRKRRQLKPGMYAEGLVRGQVPEVLAVPRTAILFPGGAAYAYVDKGGGAYERRRLKLGRQSDEFWEVLNGVEEGDSVVTSGNMLMDAQAQFNIVSKAEGNDAEEMMTVEAAGPHSSGREVLTLPEIVPQGAEAMAVEDQPRRTSTALFTANPDRAAAAPSSATPHAAAGRTERMAALMSPGGELQMIKRAAILQELAMKATNAPQPSVAAMTANDPPPGDTRKAAGATSLTGAQRELVQAFLAEAGGVSQALAADNLESVNGHVAKLPALLQPLTNGLPVTLSPLLQRISACQWQSAKDLADARKQFLPFSTAVVDLAKQLRKQDEAFAAIKIYHCPMAPEPGLWIQTKGPLANAFYGSKMLRCGEEVVP